MVNEAMSDPDEDEPRPDRDVPPPHRPIPDGVPVTPIVPDPTVPNPTENLGVIDA